MNATHKAIIVIAILQAEKLKCLQAWPPAGALVQDAVSAARGRGSLSVHDAKRISQWAARWEAVPPRMKTFYEDNAGDADVSAALWHILNDYPRPVGARYGRIIQLWVDRHATRPPFSLIP